VLPGRRLAVLGEGEEAEALALRLADAGAAVTHAPRAARVLGRSRASGLLLPGGERLACDAVAVAGPPAPATDLARQLGAGVVLDPACAAFAVNAGPDGATAVPHLFVAGEATGAMDASRAAAAGRAAGKAALR
jgi:sarcosine oxidase subunit alpha